MTSRGGHLIFLVSQPRAGSTLLQRVIGSHSRVHTAPEPWLALHPLFALKADATAAPGDTALADRATREFLARIPRGETIYLDGVRHLLGSVYDAALAASGKSVFLDKTPRYYQILPELRRVFPDAHVVILLRNPIAVLSSMLETWIDEDGGDGLHLLKEDLLGAPPLLASWLRRRDPATVVVHYETLVEDPESTINRVCQVLGLASEPAMLDYRRSTPAVERSAFGDQGTSRRHTRPVDSRVNHWREVMMDRPAWRSIAAGYIRALSADDLDIMGYNHTALLESVGSAGDADDAAFAAAIGWSAERRGLGNRVRRHGRRLLGALRRAATARRR